MGMIYFTYEEEIHDIPVKVHIVFSRRMPELAQYRCYMWNITQETRTCLENCIRKAGLDPKEWSRFFFYYNQREFAIGVQVYPNDPDILTKEDQQLLGLTEEIQ